MIYIDTSSLLKTLWREPESAAVAQAIASETCVVISSLAALETEVQLRARQLAGNLTSKKYEAYRAAFLSYRETAPFEFRSLPGSLFEQATAQHLAHKTVHCRTLDRLHLAAMENLQIGRLLTNDLKQAAAAKAIGYEVIVPGDETHVGNVYETAREAVQEMRKAASQSGTNRLSNDEIVAEIRTTRTNRAKKRT